MAGSFDKSGIIEFFLVEAGEHIQNLNSGLLALEKTPDDRAVIDELFRAAHTLKGSAAMMGFQGVSDVGHKAEDMLGLFRSGSIPISRDTLNFLFDCVDAVKLMVDGIASKKPEDPLIIENISQSFKSIVDTFRGGAAAVPAEKVAAAAPPPPLPPQAALPVIKASEKPATLPSKEELDLAWENAFAEETGEAPKQAPPPKSSIPKQAAPVPPRPAAPVPPRPAAPVMAPPPSATKPAVPTPPAATATQPSTVAAAAAEASLRQELEDAKKAGVVEKRGFGRRAADAVEVEKQFIRVNIERLDNLMNLVGEMVVNRNKLTRQVDLIKNLRDELAFSQNRLLHEIRKFEEKYEYTMNFQAPALSGPEQRPAGQSGDFFELEFDRYDDFNLLSRKLAEITNDTNEIMIEFSGFFDSFELDTSRISTITSNLQDEITQARMVEMDRLFQLFQRPVRDLAQAENKKINMVVTGGDTKIDKTIFEIISDPIMHMVRNAISHGIEGPEERTRLGKEPGGALILSARHDGSSIVLQIEDDGRGMDPEQLRRAAVEKGFLTPGEAKAMTDGDALNLIFRPGFSTAAAVGKVSGRGVGMDVVTTQLGKINGRIEIKTEKGVGTRFIIRLPLTLAIAQALIVKVKDQEVAVPMNLVEETTRFSDKDIQHAAGEEMINLRGSLLRLMRLNTLLTVGKLPKREEDFRYPTLILVLADKRLALMVEDIIGREEIVVKSLGDYLKNVRMFSGATISGEGDVRLILNVAHLFGEETISTKTSYVGGREASAAEAQLRKPRVLVVDDSISIRKYVQRFLDRSGYEVETATDGMNALEALAKQKYDAVITDLEMPVMHGYDLIAEMKRNPVFASVPIIVLTSRAGEKHRQKAIDMGAQDYLVKPFEEQEMIEALKRLLAGVTLAARA
ncbi:MAG: putative Chemotaxis protein CheA modulated with response regulator receiver region (Modular protein) [Nitrospirae bacterium]|nr:putative Chemotaxis protein CheA modulated with response regulator receiver region (Modular protein) [Nitrospirota bacterium]